MKPLLGLFSLLVSTLSFSNVHCSYPSKQEQSIESYMNCGQIKGDHIVLAASHMENIIFDKNGLTCIMVSDRRVFYMNSKGQSRRVVFNDNGCDYFEEGFARGYENGKIVFIDKQLKVKIKPNFELLLPFDYEHAVVCNGPFEAIQQGEYTLQRKGKCGLINKQGKLVVEAKYPIENREVFQDYINNHNHCPKPPITNKKSAICHAKRHLKYTESRRTTIKSIKQNKELWLVRFTYSNDSESLFEIELNAKAGWNSIMPIE